MAPRFSTGELVEVRSADGSFWREARLVHAFAILPRRYFVSYDGGSSTETVAADLVRPRPAATPANGAVNSFRLYQLVDAFSGSGWRPGVVFKVHVADGEWGYVVCFPERREESEFRAAQMRPHLDWVDGKWVSPEQKRGCSGGGQDQSGGCSAGRVFQRKKKGRRKIMGKMVDKQINRGITEMLYSKGTLVEVASVSKRLPVAWYPAIVIEVVDKNILVVEYETLRAEENSALKEIVASQYIRPYPPRASHSGKFDLLDEVEAFYSNGWWPGVVAKVHHGSRYNVKFLHWEEEIEFSQSELRLLYDWIDGQWVQASQDKSITSQNFGGNKSVGHTQLSHASSYKVPVIITLSDGGDEASCELPTSPTNVDNENMDILTLQSQQESPCKKLKKGEAIEENSKLLDCLVMAKGTEAPNGVNTEPDGPMPVIEEEPNFCIKAIVEKSFPTSPSKNITTSQVATTISSSNILLGDTSDDSLIYVDVPMPVREEGPNFRIKALLEKSFSTSPSKKINVTSQVMTTKTSLNVLLGDRSDESLMPKKLIKQSSLFHEHVGVIGLVDKGEQPSNLGTRISGTNDFLQPAECEQNKGVSCPMVNGEPKNKLYSNYQPDGDKGVGHVTLGEKRRKKSRPQKLRITEPSLEGDSMRNQQDIEVMDEQPSQGLSTSHPEVIVRCGTFANGLEARDLLNAAVGSSDASLVETSLSGVQLSETGSATQNEVLLSTVGELAKRVSCEKATDASNRTLDRSPREKSSWPFEKCSSVWDFIESMEVFSIMPQQPHFQPLKHNCIELREGMAIGLMISFSNLVGSIGKLQITDSHCKFDERLKALVQLEANGFSVEHIKARIIELLRMKDNLEQAMDRRSDLKLMFTEKQNEKEQLNAEIESIDMFVIELEQSLSKVHEIKNSIAEQRRENDSEVAKLQMDLKTAETSLLSAEHDFEATLSAAWPPS